MHSLDGVRLQVICMDWFHWGWVGHKKNVIKPIEGPALQCWQYIALRSTTCAQLLLPMLQCMLQSHTHMHDPGDPIGCEGAGGGEEEGLSERWLHMTCSCVPAVLRRMQQSSENQPAAAHKLCCATQQTIGLI